MTSRPPALLLALALIRTPTAQGQGTIPIPPKIVSQGMPPIPSSLADRFDPYWQRGSVVFRGWYGGRREMLVLSDQVYRLRRPEPDDELSPLTQFPRPVLGAYPRPGRHQFVVAYDRQGRDRHQHHLFVPVAGSSVRFTDGAVALGQPEWSRSGRFLALTESLFDPDMGVLRILEPGNKSASRRFADLGAYLQVGAWSPDDRRLAVINGAWKDRNNVHLVEIATGRAEMIGTYPAGATWVDYDHKTPIRWSRDGRSLYWTSRKDSDFFRLVRYDLETKVETPMLPGLLWDVEEFDVADDSRTIAVIANEDGFSVLHILDARTGQEQPAPRLPPGSVSGLAFRAGSREFAFTLDACDSPNRVHSYDLDNGRSGHWRREEDRLELAATRPPEVIRYPSFDGRSIPALVNRPSGRFAPPYPVLIGLHGGPNAQARPGYLFPESFLVNELGVCVIRPNVRGSTGYGSAYECLDDGPGREGAVKDVGALLDWIAAQPDLDKGRIAVRGHSYGGFLTLATLAAFGDRVRSGVDFAGESDLETFLSWKSPNPRGGIMGEFGDPADEAVKSMMRSISPLANAAKIRAPLLVMHGENDPRVSVSEAAQIVARVRRNGVPVWCILGRGQGHGFTDWESYQYSVLAEIHFLRKYLLPATPPKSAGILSASVPGS